MTTDVKTKPKLALYWAASCGGCEIAVLDIKEKILVTNDVSKLKEAYGTIFQWFVDKIRPLEVEPTKDEVTEQELAEAIRTIEKGELQKLQKQSFRMMKVYEKLPKDANEQEYLIWKGKLSVINTEIGIRKKNNKW